MANEKYLVDLATRPKQERSEIARKGQRASAKVKREKKLMREIAQQVLDMPLKNGAVKDIQTIADVAGANITVQQAILLAMAKKAMKGDKGAAEFVRDTAGQTVASSVNVNVDQSEKLADIIGQLGGDGLEE